jgi:hypothetical protein
LRFSGRDYEEYYLLGREAMKFVRSLPTFRRDLLSPSAGLKNKPSMQAATRLGLFLNLGNWGSTFFRNVGEPPGRQDAGRPRKNKKIKNTLSFKGMSLKA